MCETWFLETKFSLKNITAITLLHLQLNNFSYEGKAFSMYNVPYKQVAVYSYSRKQNHNFFYFHFTGKTIIEHHDIEKQKQILKAEFINSRWKCPELLSQIDSTIRLLF